MKKKHNEGFSLVEVLVAIVILGIFVVPTCSSLIMTFQMNQKTAQMLKAQQAVSSAVETLKAEGIDGIADAENRFLPEVKVDVKNQVNGCYEVYFEYNDENGINLDVTTYIREKTGGGS